MAIAAAELTDQEAKVAQMLGDAWNEYLKLPVEHPMEQKEFCSAIHACQSMVLARCGSRAFNSHETYRRVLEVK